MFTAPENMPMDSKVWIYQANRMLNAVEKEEITTLAKDFIESWTAHHKELKGSFEIRHDLFLLIYLDENHNKASGCSIDKSLHFIKKMEEEYGLSLLERTNIAIREKSGLKVFTREAFLKELNAGLVNDATIVFNNLITRKTELDTLWEVPLGKSWIKQAY